MAKNQNRQTAKAQPASGRQPVRKADNQPVQDAKVPFYKRHLNLLLVIGVAVATWCFYHSCIYNQITNWDDPGYVKDDALIKDLSSEGLKNIFSTAIMGNYHPLTILSYAIEYSYVRLQPMQYHIDSLLLHILVTILVYAFVWLLTRRPVAAMIASLLFGLHPMHVESVAWLAGRKDVVYGVFYMAACITWVYYVRAVNPRRWLWYAVTTVLFLCSLLGKPVAVVLPVTLLLIDYFERRKLNLWLLIEKIPLYAISIGFGIRSLHDQKSFGSIDTQDVSFSGLERLALGGYAFISYLWKAIVPAGLANFYPYPLKEGNSLPAVYYLYPLATLLILALLIVFARKNRVVVFGALFFLVNIALLLQFLPVGGAIIADRYTYIPYLGLFFIVGWYMSKLFEPGANRQLGNIILMGVLGYACVLGYLSNERCKVWYDTTSLWRDEIEKEPVRAPNAWNNLGFNYFNKFNDAVDPAEKKKCYDSAYVLLTHAIELQPTFVNPYISLGELNRSVGKFPEAKVFYYKALSLKAIDEQANAYLGLAIIYAISHNFDSSDFCFRQALKTKTYFPEAQSNYGNFFDMTQRPDSALAHYGIAISQNPDMYAPHLNRGRLLLRLGRVDDAINDLNTALELNPDNGEVLYARSYCYMKKGNRAQALRDAQDAIKFGFTHADPNYIRSLRGQ